MTRIVCHFFGSCCHRRKNSQPSLKDDSANRDGECCQNTKQQQQHCRGFKFKNTARKHSSESSTVPSTPSTILEELRSMARHEGPPFEMTQGRTAWSDHKPFSEITTTTTTTTSSMARCSSTGRDGSIEVISST
jgi:hypothetical protein